MTSYHTLASAENDTIFVVKSLPDKRACGACREIGLKDLVEMP